MTLEIICQEKLYPTPPFDFDSTFHKPDHFPSDDHIWEPGVLHQTFRWQGEHFGIKCENRGEVEAPEISVTVFGESANITSAKSLLEEITYRFNLNYNLRDFYQSFEKDPVLGPILLKWRGLRPGHPNSLYEYLIIGIALQNATVRRSVQMLKALQQKYGILVEFDGRALWSYWEPGALQSVSEEGLRSLKLGYRAKFIKRIDTEFHELKIDENDLRKQDREVQKNVLISLYGIGPATVWYLLFDIFHHWDSFEHISPWEQKIYSKLFFDEDPENPVPVEQLLHRFAAYEPYRHLAVHYIWEDIWWKRKNESIPWLEKLIRR